MKSEKTGNDAGHGAGDNSIDRPIENRTDELIDVSDEAMRASSPLTPMHHHRGRAAMR